MPQTYTGVRKNPLNLIFSVIPNEELNFKGGNLFSGHPLDIC